MRARSINVGVFAAAIGGVMGLMCGSLCGCDRGKAPGATAAAGVGAGGPKRVDVEAETARLMARMPVANHGEPRVFDAALELERIVANLALQVKAPEEISETILGQSGFFTIPGADRTESNAARRTYVKSLSAAGAFELMDVMAKGNLASDVKFIPFDQTYREPTLDPPGLLACFARTRIALEDGDIPAFQRSLRAAIAYVRADGQRPTDYIKYENLRRLLFRELCAMVEAREDAMVHNLVRDEIQRLGPRDTTHAIEYERIYSLDCAAAAFDGSEYSVKLHNDPKSFFPEWMLTRRMAERERELGAVAGMDLGTYQENVRAINAVMDWAQINASLDPWRRSGDAGLEEAVPEVRELVMVMWTGRTAKQLLSRHSLESMCYERGLHARLAADMYRLKAYRYPSTLEEISPDEATRANWRDPHADALMRYEVYDEGQRVRIWSVGPNGKDENGKGDDVVVFEK